VSVLSNAVSFVFSVCFVCFVRPSFDRLRMAEIKAGRKNIE